MQDAAQRARADGDVVADEVQLRLAAGREEDLLGVRDRDLVAVDLDGHRFAVGTFGAPGPALGGARVLPCIAGHREMLAHGHSRRAALRR